MSMLSFEQAKEYLSTKVKWENRDHAFGDCEVGWTDGPDDVASGYFSGRHRSVYLSSGEVFDDKEADELRKCFSSEEIDRNDETGPAEFSLGETMPGLTKEGVRKELTMDGAFDGCTRD